MGKSSLYKSLLHYWTAFINGVIALLLAALMMITTVDVIGRYVFDSPLPGSTELTEFCMGLLVFATLPIICRRNQHITVDLLDERLSPFFKKWSDLVMQIILFFGMGFLGYGMYLLRERAIRDELVSEILLIPVWIFRFLTMFLIMLSMIAVVFYSFSRFQKNKN